MTSISAYAYSGCTGVTSVSVAASVTSISSTAFSGITFYDSDGITVISSVSAIAGCSFSGTASKMVKTGSSVPTPPPTPVTNYTVTYNANGGSGSVPSSSTVQSGQSYTILFSPAPSKSGMNFMGWSDSKTDSNAKYTSEGLKTITVTNNVTLYAVYGSTEGCTVTYNINGGSGSVPGKAVVNAGQVYDIQFSPAPTKAASTFLGWSDSNTDTTAKYTYDGLKSITVMKNVTLYAIYKADKLTVTYDANGGTGDVPDTVEVKYGDTFEIRFAYLPSMEGKYFIGWSESKNTAVPEYTRNGMDSFIVDGSKTLYAIYSTAPLPGLIYNTVVFSENNVNNFTEQLISGLSYTINTNTKWEGHKFLGWLIDGEIYQVKEHFIAPNHDIQMVAQWELIAQPEEIHNSEDASMTLLAAIGFGVVVAGSVVALVLWRKKP